jgi:hypothetical protein
MRRGVVLHSAIPRTTAEHAHGTSAIILYLLLSAGRADTNDYKKDNQSRHDYLYLASAARLAAISASQRSPLASSRSLL